MEEIAVIITIIGIYALGYISGRKKSESFDKGYETGHIVGIRKGYDMCKSKYEKILSEIKNK